MKDLLPVLLVVLLFPFSLFLVKWRGTLVGAAVALVAATILFIVGFFDPSLRYPCLLFGIIGVVVFADNLRTLGWFNRDSHQPD